MSDYISRDLAKAYFTPEHAIITPISVRVETLLQAIDNIPAADVAPVVHGQWIFEKGDGQTSSDGWVCSACNCGFHTNVPYFEDFNFCPNCGADMRGENDG